MKAVTLQNITKTYDKGKVLAVDNVSLEIEKGELFGLIGPDGAALAFAITGDDCAWRFPWPDDLPYLRSQVVAPDGEMLAVSNPVWRE